MKLDGQHCREPQPNLNYTYWLWTNSLNFSRSHEFKLQSDWLPHTFVKESKQLTNAHAYSINCILLIIFKRPKTKAFSERRIDNYECNFKKKMRKTQWVGSRLVRLDSGFRQWVGPELLRARVLDITYNYTWTNMQIITWWLFVLMIVVSLCRSLNRWR